MNVLAPVSGSSIQISLIPSATGVRTTRRCFTASTWRSSAAFGATLNTALRTERLKFASTCSGAFGNTDVSIAVVVSSSRVMTVSARWRE